MRSGVFADYKIFAGNSHPELAEEIAGIMGKPLGRATVTKFSDGEISVNIWETVRGLDVYIIQSTCNPVNDNLMELLIMIDAMKRASAGRINAVIPYYGYARQDRKAKARDPITAKLVADLIVAAGRWICTQTKFKVILIFRSITCSACRFWRNTSRKRIWKIWSSCLRITAA